MSYFEVVLMTLFLIINICGIGYIVGGLIVAWMEDEDPEPMPLDGSPNAWQDGF